MIQFRNIKKSFGPKTVLDEVSFDVPTGSVFFIIGASGVGKSVLIKHLVGLLYPDQGEIWLDGEEISKLDEKGMGPIRKKCAMVFQHSTLFDSMSCAENVALPLRKHKNMSMKAALAEARQRLAQVHMGEFGDRYPAELGDGMRKRVAIARALTLDPQYVLFACVRADESRGTIGAEHANLAAAVDRVDGSVEGNDERVVGSDRCSDLASVDQQPHVFPIGGDPIDTVRVARQIAEHVDV